MHTRCCPLVTRLQEIAHIGHRMYIQQPICSYLGCMQVHLLLNQLMSRIYL
jgi:hypothetical protein